MWNWNYYWWKKNFRKRICKTGYEADSPVFIHSIKYKAYTQDREYYYRPPNHLNPVKKSKVQPFQFALTNRGEDTDWAMKICKAQVLEKEKFIDEVLYFYHFDFATSETQREKITHR